MKNYEVWDNSNFAQEFHMKTEGSKQISSKKNHPQILRIPFSKYEIKIHPRISRIFHHLVDMLSTFLLTFLPHPVTGHTLHLLGEVGRLH